MNIPEESPLEKENMIWIDLTDLSVWSGHFTGIQRVVFSYASRFAAEGARFFVYDKIEGRHVEVEFSILEQLKAAVANPTLTKRQKMKRFIGSPYYALSDKHKEMVRPLVQTANNVVHTTLHKTVDKDRSKSPFHSYPLADFSHGDVVILIGAGWNEASSLDLLCARKAETGIKIIQHINDILPVYQPQLFADSLPKIFTPYVDMVVKNVDIITVISEATRRDLSIFCKENNLVEPTIRVVRLGEDVLVTDPKQPEGFNLTEGFVLSVGTFEIRKNYLLLYQAAKLAQLEGKSFPNIVIAGRKGWLTEDLSHVLGRDPFTQDKVRWLCDLSDDELSWLYEHCMFTVFPSLCEGWGLPMVESLQHGKMCIASNVSSMLEIGDGMIDYFSPYDARSCMDKIIQYSVGSYQDRNRIIRDSYEVYTWDDSYKSFKAAVAT